MSETSKNENWWKYVVLGGSIISASAIGYYFWNKKKIGTLEEVDPTGNIKNQQIFGTYTKNSKFQID
jgi:hypothetical protein